MNLLRNILFIIIFVAISAPVSSQVDPPPDSGFPATPPTLPPPVPLTGVEYLIAAGAAFGVKKYLEARKRRHAQDETGVE